MNELRDIDDFILEIEIIPWFANLGKEISNTDVDRISSSEKWPGPEDSSVLEICLRQQALFDEMLANSGQYYEMFDKLFHKIQSIVISQAKKRVPYDDKEDYYYWANVAAWDAAWTAGLVGLFLVSNKDLPIDIEMRWKWFVLGHWPCTWNESILEPRFAIY
jgi:hypothetical protein